MNFLARLKSDYTYIAGLKKMEKALADITPDAAISLVDDIEKSVDNYPDNIAFWDETAPLTYRAFDGRANRFAHWGRSAGLRAGDCVALFMENRPDYVAFWAGMAKIGVVTALINTHLHGASLAHCINLAKAKAILLSDKTYGAFKACRDDLQGEIAVWSIDIADDGAATSIPDRLAGLPDSRPSASLRGETKARDVALYIYTSGTTGLPKAARMTHARCLQMMRAFVSACDITQKDRLLLTLPLYHATGGLCGVGAALTTGAGLAVVERFSASSFWRQARRAEATTFVYVGELCRFLLNNPPSAEESDHQIVKAFGNGMRPEVWRPFVKRTGIEKVMEFYGSTEGNISFFNLDAKSGAIGRIPPIVKSLIPIRLIRVDDDANEPVRGDEGLCIEANIGEPGEAVGRIVVEDVHRRFEGYHDAAQTDKKILREVFKKGDAYFRSGDLLRRDRDGYFYFVDRIGDTFRWRSENVSTTEVSEVISLCDGVNVANVYGVEVPGYDGRAGMAAITTGAAFEFHSLFAHLQKELPSYAHPVFIRLQNEQFITGTFKLKKTDLQTEGFRENAAGEPVFLIDPGEETYIPLTAKIREEICVGQYRL